MTAAPSTTRGRYAADESSAREYLRPRHAIGLGLGFAGTSATLAACFVPVVADEDFRLALDDWRTTIPVFVAVAAGFAAVSFMIRRTRPVAAGFLAGVGLVSAAYFGSWVARIMQFERDLGIGTYVGLGGGLLMVLGAVVLTGLRGGRDIGLVGQTLAGRDGTAAHAAPVVAPTAEVEPSPAQLPAEAPPSAPRPAEEPSPAPRPAEGAPTAPRPTEEQPPAGWYPDPAGRARLRYWTGTSWTAKTQD
jgi:hypothetical protein